MHTPRADRVSIESVGADRWLHAAWDLTADALVVSDADGRVLAANPAYYALYGYPPEEVLGQSFAIIFPPAERAAAEAAYREVFQALDAPATFESVVRRRDGAERLVESRYRFVESDGQRVAMLSILHDVTDETAARERVAQAERERREFLSSLSHDLKTPLAIIKGHAQMLRRQIQRCGEVPPVEHVVARLTQIETSVADVAGFMTELVEVAELRPGETHPLHRVEVDLVPLVRGAVERHQRLADEHTLAFESTAPAIVGHWDVARLERILDNLLSNAIKYSPGGGHVAVHLTLGVPPVTTPGADNTPLMNVDGALLSVSDDGIGIAPADLPHVFERFQRGHNVPDLVPGSGVGLTSVRSSVEQHGGRVGITSTPGTGTTIWVWLPLGGDTAAGEAT